MSQKATYLDRILEHHRALAAIDERSLADLVRRCEQMRPARGFRDRLQIDATQAIAVISEIKRQSPSKGLLRADLNPQFLADAYQAGGASCLSVLTDEDFLRGRLKICRSLLRRAPCQFYAKISLSRLKMCATPA